MIALNSTPVRPAAAADLHHIRQLELDGFEPSEQWSEASWRAELAGPDRIVLVATIAGQVVGAASWQVVGDTADLHRIVVSAGHRRRGIASVLLAEGLTAGQAAGARTVLLEVDVENEGAQALYRKFGFTELATRADYYGAGRHASVMQLSLADSEEMRPKRGAQRHSGGSFGPERPLSRTFWSESSSTGSATKECVA